MQTVAHGSEGQLPGTLYGYDRVSSVGKQILLNMLSPLRAPQKESLVVQARHVRGPYELVIVRVPWQPAGSDRSFHPILLGRENGRFRIVGYVLPFNPFVRLLLH